MHNWIFVDRLWIFWYIVYQLNLVSYEFGLNPASTIPLFIQTFKNSFSHFVLFNYIPDSNFIDSWREKIGHLNFALASAQLYKTEQKRPNGRVVRSHSVNGQYSRVVCIWMYSQKPTALVTIHQLLVAIRIFSPYQFILWLTYWFKHSDEGDCHAEVLLWWNRVSIAQTSGVTP